MIPSAPLCGYKVLDLSWVMVGPISARYLSDLGADVIKIESEDKIDPVRLLGPFRYGRRNKEQSLAFHNLNARKRSLNVDLKSEDGREAILRLAREADVVVESFTAGTLDRLGLGWSELSRVNPSVILASTCLFGQTGPDKAAAGVGTAGAAYSGVTGLVGWPDRPPSGPFNAWTDAVAPRFIVASILTALWRREITGEGCHIDVSQAEAGIQFVLPGYLEYVVNGSIPERVGSKVEGGRVPAGIFESCEEGRWVALDASDDQSWLRLKTLIGIDEKDIRFDSLLIRLRHCAEVEEAVANWVKRYSAEAVESKLQELGIPGHIVASSSDLTNDRDLEEGGYFDTIYRADLGHLKMRRGQWRSSPAALQPAEPGPILGESTGESWLR